MYPPGGRISTGETPHMASIFWLVEPIWLMIPSALSLEMYLWSWVWFATSQPWATIRLIMPALAFTLEPTMKKVALPPLACRLSRILPVTDALGPSSKVSAIMGLEGRWKQIPQEPVPVPQEGLRLWRDGGADTVYPESSPLHTRGAAVGSPVRP